MWFPNWSLRRPDAPSDRPFLVVEPPPASTVVAVSAGLEAIEAGMPRRQAEGLYPEAVVLIRDRDEETRRFEPLVQLVEEIVPRVEVSDPGLLFVPLSGALRYYRAEDEIVRLIGEKLAGEEAKMGVADGPFAASLAAKAANPALIVSDTGRFLQELDVTSLATGRGEGVESLVATFRWLGITTLGDMAALPREAIASRFGASGIEMHRLARGEDRSVTPRSIPTKMAVEMVFEDPLENLDRVAFAAREAASRLMSRMHSDGIAPHRVGVEIEGSDGTVRARVWRSGDPFTEEALADRVWWQMRAWIEQSQIQGGVRRLRIDPADVSGEGRQLGFCEDVSAWVEAERAVGRVQALLGPDSVLQADTQGGRMPGDRVAWRRWGESVAPSGKDESYPWPGSIPQPSPALVPEKPPILEVEWDGGMPVRVRLGTHWEPVSNWAGPWRFSGKWWEGGRPQDRYQIVTSAGAFLCTVEDGVTRLAGIYD